MSDWTPPEEFDFAASRPGAGSGHRTVSLSGLRFRLEGLDEETDAFVARRFRRYLAAEDGEPTALRLAFRRADRGPYLEPDSGDGVIETYQMQHAVRDGALYYATGSTCGRVDLTTGTGTILVRPRVGRLVVSDPVFLATENLLRAALAWIVLLRGGFVLHAASVVRDGRCYLFYGNSGSGKSTIAAICGGQVISDDLTLMVPHEEGFAAIGSPFRGTYTACEDLTERYPVVGIFRLRKSAEVSVRPFTGPIAFADFVANLPYVVSEIDRHAGAWDRIRAAFKRLRSFELHFRRDDSFWPAIDALALTA